MASSMSASRMLDTNRVEYRMQLKIDNRGKCSLGEFEVPYRASGTDDRMSLRTGPIELVVRANPLPMRLAMGAAILVCAVLTAIIWRRIARFRREERDADLCTESQTQQHDLAQRLEDTRAL